MKGGPSIRDRGQAPPTRGGRGGLRPGRSFTAGRSTGRGPGRGRGAPPSTRGSDSPSRTSVSPPKQSEVTHEVTQDDVAEVSEPNNDIDPEDQKLLDLLNSDDENDNDDDNDDDEIEPINHERDQRSTEDSYALRDSNYFDEDGVGSGSEDELDDALISQLSSFDQNDDFDKGGDDYDFDEDEEHRKLLAALEDAIDSDEEEEEEDEEGNKEQRSSEEVEDPSFIGDDEGEELASSGIVSPFSKSVEGRPKTPPPIVSPAEKRRDRVRLRVKNSTYKMYLYI